MSFIINPFVEDDEDDSEMEVMKKGTNNLISFDESAYISSFSVTSPFPLDIFSDYDHFTKENEFNALVVLQRKIEQEMEDGRMKDELEKEIQKVLILRGALSKIEGISQICRGHEQRDSQASCDDFRSFLPFLASEVENKGLSGVVGSTFLNSHVSRELSPFEKGLTKTIEGCFSTYSGFGFSSRKEEPMRPFPLSSYADNEVANERARRRREQLLPGEQNNENIPPESRKRQPGSTGSLPISSCTVSALQNTSCIDMDILWSSLRNLCRLLRRCTSEASNLSHTTTAEKTNFPPPLPVLQRILLILLKDLSRLAEKCWKGVADIEKVNSACNRFFPSWKYFPSYQSRALNTQESQTAEILHNLLLAEVQKGCREDEAISEAFELLRTLMEGDGIETEFKARDLANSEESVFTTRPFLHEALIGHTIDLTSKRARLNELIREATKLGNVLLWLRRKKNVFSLSAQTSSAIGDQVDILKTTGMLSDMRVKDNQISACAYSSEDGLSSQTEAILLLRKYTVELSGRICNLLTRNVFFFDRNRSINCENQEVKTAFSCSKSDLVHPQVPIYSAPENHTMSCVSCRGNHFLRAEIGFLSLFVSFQESCLHLIAQLNYLLLGAAEDSFFQFYLRLHQNFKTDGPSDKSWQDPSIPYPDAQSSSSSNSAHKVTSADSTDLVSAESKTDAFLQLSGAIQKQLLELCDGFCRAAMTGAEHQTTAWCSVRKKLERHCLRHADSTVSGNCSSREGISSQKDHSVSVFSDKNGLEAREGNLRGNVSDRVYDSFVPATDPINMSGSDTNAGIRAFFKIFCVSPSPQFGSTFSDHVPDEMHSCCKEQKNCQQEDYNMLLEEIEGMKEKIVEVLQHRQEEATKRMKWFRLQPYGLLLLEMIDLEKENTTFKNLCDNLVELLETNTCLGEGSHEKNSHADMDVDLEQELTELEAALIEMESHVATSMLEFA